MEVKWAKAAATEDPWGHQERIVSRCEVEDYLKYKTPDSLPENDLMGYYCSTWWL